MFGNFGARAVTGKRTGIGPYNGGHGLGLGRPAEELNVSHPEWSCDEMTPVKRRQLSVLPLLNHRSDSASIALSSFDVIIDDVITGMRLDELISTPRDAGRRPVVSPVFRPTRPMQL